MEERSKRKKGGERWRTWGVEQSGGVKGGWGGGQQPPFVFHDASVLHYGGGVFGRGREGRNCGQEKVTS